jgi:hypothetical protein
MSDPSRLTDALDNARDSFRHAHGTPTFEPTINASTDANDGEVQIQKACRLIEAATVLQQSGEYYGSVLEHAFASVERTLEGYLIAFADYEVTDFHDHTTVYRRGKQQVPLTTETLETLEALYDDRRTEHYYGTTVTTKRQAETLLEVAVALHDHIVQFDPELTRYCNCGK